MKNNKLKSAVIIGAMAVLAVSGGILAYFTDTEENQDIMIRYHDHKQALS